MVSATKKTDSQRSDTYMELIRRFPLRPIRGERAHHRATKMVGELLGHRLDRGAADYLDTLVMIVNRYEDEYHTSDRAALSPQETLRAIMSANALTQSDIGKVIGSESAVSMFLRGERALSKAQIKALVSRFRIEAALFL